MKRICFIALASLLCMEYAFSQTSQLWGMTSAGGANNLGTIFEINSDGSGFHTCYSFSSATGASPQGSLLYNKNDGNLYGIAQSGGANGYGSIFRFNPATNIFSDIYAFTGSGAFPNGTLILGADNLLYGYNSSGWFIFSYDYVNNIFSKIVTLNAAPVDKLLQIAGGSMFGLSNGGNGIGSYLFKFNPSAQSFTNLDSFRVDASSGFYAKGSLIQATNGKLYGMFYTGGVNSPVIDCGLGTIFSYDLSGAGFEKLYDFNYPSGQNPDGSLMLAANGLLYGMTSGANNCSNAGTVNAGNIFSFNTTTNSYSDLYDFTSHPTMGANPAGSLIQAANGNLYGMIPYGSANGYGSVIEYNLTSNTCSALHSFDGTDGQTPLGDLTEIPNYITTGSPPSFLCPGTTFSVTYSVSNGLALNSGNMFTIQLSDSSGSFVNPVRIDSASSTNLSGSISGTIPLNTIPGIHYRVRIVSSNLVSIGKDNGTDITIDTLYGNFTAAQLILTYPDTIAQFSNLAVNPRYTYNWSFGDGTSPIQSNNQNIFHTYTTNGIFSVDLIVTDGGCSDTVTKAGYIDATGNPAGILQTAYPQLSLSPNPTTGLMRIRLPDAVFDYKLYDITGRMVLSGGQIQGNVIVDASSLDAGVYILKVFALNGGTTRKIYKQ